MLNLASIRAAFPHTATQTYLNHAATGVYSRPVVAALEDWIRERSGDCIENYIQTMPKVEDAFARLGRLLCVAPSRLEFTANTSEALSILAEGFPWQPGDRVAVPACEFPANVYPFMHLARKGVEVDFVPHEDGVVSLDAFERAMTPRTRLVSVSMVQFLSGHRLDLAALAEIVHARGAYLCVDAIQGLGVLQLRPEEVGIDFLACGTQKWLLATQGLGFLYCTEALQERLDGRAGWLHGPVDWDRFLDYRLAFHEDAHRFQLGTRNHMGIMALRAALTLYEETGHAACEAHALALADRLRDGLRAQGLAIYGQAGGPEASPIVTFRHPAPEALVAALAAARITVSTRNRLVRVSPTWYNDEADIDRLLDAVETFAPDRPYVPASPAV